MPRLLQRLITLCAMGALLIARPAPAQSPSDRTAIDSFRSVLAATTDPTALDSPAADPGHCTSDGDGRVRTVCQAWLELRRAELSTGAEFALHAADDFYAAANRRPAWPYPWYGLGATKQWLAAPRVRNRISAHQPSGADWSWGATDAFFSAARADPAWLPGLAALVDAVELTAFEPRAIEARRALEPGRSSLAADPTYLLALGRIERMLDSLPAARIHLESALAAGADSATTLIELGRLAYAEGRSAEAARDLNRAGPLIRSDGAASLFAATTAWAAENVIPPDEHSAAAAARADLAAGPDDPTREITLGRTERDLDSLQASIAAFQHARVLGGDTAIADLEEGWSRFLLHPGAIAESLYFDGAGRIRSDEARARYRRDLAWIATPAELAAFDLAPVDSLPALLSRFWGGRDRAAGTRTGRRLAEHYRRLAFALRHYPSETTFGADEVTLAFRHPPSELDDRGIIYVRQGAPDATATFEYPCVPTNESWAYFHRGGNLVFHFARFGTAGFRIIRSLRDLVVDAPWQLLPALYESRAELDPQFAKIAFLAARDSTHRDSTGAFRFVPPPVDVCSHHREPPPDIVATLTEADFAAERAAADRSVALGTTTDRDALSFEAELHPIVQVFGAAVPGANRAQLLVEYALPAERALPGTQLPDSSWVYPIRLRIDAVRGTDSLGPSTDSVRLIHAPRRLQSGEFLTGYEVVDVAPGTY
ncbi:MAG: GWxTD domain-containing protein, partial [Gemmatimonadales bacterium]